MAFTTLALLGIALFNLVFFTALLTAGVHFLGRTIFRILYSLLCLFLSLYLFAYTYHFLLYGQLIGDPSISALLDTNPQEALEFLNWATDWRRVLLALLAAVLAALALALTTPRSVPRPSRRIGLAAVALAGLMLPVGAWHRGISYFNPGFFLPRSVTNNLLYRAAAERMQAALEKNSVGDVTRPTERAATHILIIGESTTRRHMSLYGYERDTTPNLRRLAPELYVAEDVCSSRGQTVPALQELLTFASREDLAPLFEKPSLLQILKAAGFRTWWLSNQQLYGRWDNWSAILSGPADTRVFVNRVGWGAGVSLDEQLLAPLTMALADPAPLKFVIVHLLGAHAEYSLRYAPAFARFTNVSLPSTPRRLQGIEIDRYNAYDNAVLYTDHVVAQIIDAARETGENASVTFLSDHGEALGEVSDFHSHIDGPAPRQVYEIPFTMWISPALRNRLGAKVEDLRENLTRPYQTDSVINTLLDLYGIDHAGRVAERSLFAPALRIPVRYCDTLP
ncbi:phosphoethanolamine transferase [Methylobacterium sp. A49B]